MAFDGTDERAPALRSLFGEIATVLPSTELKVTNG